MKLLHRGSPLGESPCYIAPAEQVHARSLRDLFATVADRSPCLDIPGLRQYFLRNPDGTRTCFQRAQILPTGCDLFSDDGQIVVRRRDLPESNGPLLPLLEQRIAALLASVGNVAVALSGGLDSALVLALVKRVTGRTIPVLTLATGLSGYCELEETLATAQRLECGPVDVIRIQPEQLVAALPDAITACETPLFNLHPVSKLLLARAAAQRGFDAILTGDGADQVFAGSDARNYLPIVGAMVRSMGVRLLSPFFDEQIVAWGARQGVDPEKSALRTAAETLLPPEIALRKKCPRFAPNFPLEKFRDMQLEARLGSQLELRPPAAGSGPEQTLWATTALLMRQLRGSY